VESEQNDPGRPLWKGPIFGLVYLVAGLILAVVASSVGGWFALPLWVVAVLLILAGAWTALFTGFFLILAAIARRSWRSPESPPD
jgi:hypothetical protein